MGDELEGAARTLLVCHHDPARRATAAAAGEAVALRVVGEVAMLPELLAMIELVAPDVVALDRRAAGVEGPPTVEEIVRLAPTAAIVVITDEPSTAGAWTRSGAAAVALDGDRGDLEAALTRAVHALDAERGHGAGRRAGEDRRKHQDWSKVTSERRSGQDRRAEADRRDEARGADAGADPDEP